MAKKIDINGLDHYHDKVSAMFASVESSSTASKAYKTGARFYFQGSLCIATSDIAQGGTIILSPTANFNCKLDVLGDDVTAQSEQISGLNGAVFKAETINYNTVTLLNWSITAQNKWKYSSSASTRGCLISLSNVKKIHAVGSASGNSIIAFLKSDTLTDGETPDYSSTYSSRIAFNTSEVKDYDVPSDALWLYVLVGCPL